MLALLFLGFGAIQVSANEQGRQSKNSFDKENLQALESGFIPVVQIQALSDDSRFFDAGIFANAHLGQVDEESAVALADFDALEEYFSNTVYQDASSPNFGFSDDVYIIRLPLENPTEQTLNLYLEVAYSMLDKVAFFEFDRGQGDLEKFINTGDSFIFDERPLRYPNFVFPLELKPSADKVVYLRVATTSSSQFPLRIWSQSGFTHKTQSYAAFIGSLLGMVLILAIYNLFLFLSLKELNYLYIVEILTGYACVVAILNGYAYFYLWPNSPGWQDVSLVVVSNLALGGLCLFVHGFLDLPREAPRYEPIVRYFALYCFVLAILGIFLPYTLTILFTAANVIIAPVVTYIAGLWLSSRGHRAAYLYNTAFLVFVVSALILVLGKVSILPRNYITEYAIHIGAVISVLFLSFALADRVKQEKNEKEHAQRSAIDNLVKYQKIYESSLEGMMRVSLDGKLVGCNPAFAKLMGVESESELLKHMDYVPDYVPESPETLDKLIKILRETRRIFAYEVQCKRIDGSKFWGALHARYYDDGDNGRFIDASIVDITEKKLNEDKLNHIAKHDALTGVGNRVGFEVKLAHALKVSQTQQQTHALLFMDLDQFKVVNDTCGHRAGDELLKQLVNVFKNQVRSDDAIARMGGDEFVILLADVDLSFAREKAERLRKEVSEHKFFWQEKVFSVGVSIGIVPVDGRAQSSTDILSLADTACYAAKDAGRNRVVVHEALSGDIPARQSQMELANRVKTAIQGDKLALFKQKIRPLNSHHTGDMYEVLVRLPNHGQYMLPGSFIPAIERFDSMETLDYWVIEHYLKWIVAKPQTLADLQQANINVSGKTLNNESFETVISALFAKYAVPKERICFEITESEAIHNLSRASALLTDMVAKGYNFSLDDFGSGFSSFNCLKLLPVGSLKIDGSFIRNITRDPVDRAMVNSIVTVAHTMDVKVTAEYVESDEVLNAVKQLEIDFAQGYHIHRPELLTTLK